MRSLMPPPRFARRRHEALKRAELSDSLACARSCELRLLGRAVQRGRLGVGVEQRADEVEVAGADLALVLDRGVAVAGGGELLLLQRDVRRHALVGVAVG